MKKELNFPIIYNNNKVWGYGGNQEWFSKSFQRQAGCGSTSGANIAAYYGANEKSASDMYQGDTSRFQYLDYLSLMEGMYTYMTPGPLGYPYVEKFAKAFIRYSKNHNFHIKAKILEKFNTTEEAFSFVKESIDSGNPVALLILLHRAKELKDDNWHWVTITGYEEQEGESRIIISNCGKKEMIPKDVLFEVNFRNRIHMVRFYTM